MHLFNFFMFMLFFLLILSFKVCEDKDPDLKEIQIMYVLNFPIMLIVLLIVE